MLGSGPGTAIDYPAARSKTGDWLAVVTSGKLELIDGATYKREAIDADVVNDHHWTTDKNARFVSIAANGTRMTYLKGNRVMIRDLATRAERSVTVTGKLWRADVDAEGRWAQVRVMRRDTDKDGKIDWPGGPAAQSLSGCGVDTLHHRNPDGDEPTIVWLDLVTGTAVEDKTVIMPLGQHLLRRRADYALTLDGKELVEAKCNAVIERVFANPPRVAFTCGDRIKRDFEKQIDAPIEIAGPGGKRIKTKLTNRRDWGDDNFWQQTRFAGVSDAKGALSYVDLAEGTEIAVPEHSHAELEDHYLILRSKTGDWQVLDLITRKVAKLAATGDKSDAMFGLVDIGDSTFHVATGKRVGASKEHIVLVDPAGRVLYRAGADAPPGHFAFGPLRWR